MSSDQRPQYLCLAEHYEQCLAQHGDTHRGVDWPSREDATVRYDVMLDVVEADQHAPRLVDLGCGAGHLLDHLHHRSQEDLFDYQGVDISSQFIALCESKFPSHTFIQRDVLRDDRGVPSTDYVVMNGLFTERRDLSFEEMWTFMCQILERAWAAADRGIAFNVMSTQVDWQRQDLFHVPTDRLLEHVCGSLSRHTVLRHDYGLYEYTCYVYRYPQR